MDPKLFNGLTKKARKQIFGGTSPKLIPCAACGEQLFTASLADAFRVVTNHECKHNWSMPLWAHATLDTGWG